MIKFYQMSAMLLLISGLCSFASAQSNLKDPVDSDLGTGEYEYRPNPDRIRLKSTISEELAQQLKSGNPVSVRVPGDTPQIISALIIRKSEFYKPRLLSLRPFTRVEEGNLIIPIPIEVIDRLDYQPVEFKIYQSNVKQATLVPVHDPDHDYSLATREIEPDFFVRLKPNNGVAVAFENLNSFKLENELFKVEFPFFEIEGIFFDDRQEYNASVVLRNGDVISGKHSWPEQVKFETPWGKEKIEMDQVVSVTRDKSVQLVPSGVENPKFILLRESNRYAPRRQAR